MRILRFAAGLLLLPPCVIITRTLLWLVKGAQPSAAQAAVPPAAWALAGGIAAWLAVYYTLPRPVRAYILAHELTHALWGSAMGARILSLKVSAQKGSVTLSKSNFLVTLAPYFFPLYTVLVIMLYCILSLFFKVENYYLLWLALVGFTWGFHLTFTLSTLMQRQTDIEHNGRLLSYSLIYLMNVLGICLWIVAVSSPTLEQMVEYTADITGSTFGTAWDGVLGAIEAGKELL